MFRLDLQLVQIETNIAVLISDAFDSFSSADHNATRFTLVSISILLITQEENIRSRIFKYHHHEKSQITFPS